MGDELVALYKYYSNSSPYLIDALANALDQGFFFSSYYDLNDPFEGSPAVASPAQNTTLREIEEGAFQEFLRSIRAGEAPPYLIDFIQRLGVTPEEFHLDISRMDWDRHHSQNQWGWSMMMSDFAVYCLSRRWDSHLMWAHYANSSRGLCVKLVADERCYIPGYPRMDTVLYSAERPLLATAAFYNDLMRRQNEQRASAQSMWYRPDLVTTFLSQKSLDWAYEEEVRFIGFQGSQSYYALPHLQMHEIIIGPRASGQFTATICYLFQKYVPVYKIYFHKETYELVKRRLKLSSSFAH